MPYYTRTVTFKPYQYTLEDVINGTSVAAEMWKDTKNTCTILSESQYAALRKDPKASAKILHFERALKDFNARHAALFERPRQEMYNTFFIQKQNGKRRRIDAPNGELKEALRSLCGIIQQYAPNCYHTTAFAYVKGRCHVDAVRRHQHNNSRWFLKMDMSNFFGSVTEEFTHRAMSAIFPFSFLYHKGWEGSLEKALSLCFVDGVLPQGAPTSPMLTNIVMIPFDHVFSNKLKKDGKVYTRYADDITVSCKYDFDPRKVQEALCNTLRALEYPLVLNDEKTHYGSRAGRNWVLGVMLNDENKVTVGHKRKRCMKTLIFDFMNAYKAGTPWSVEDTQVLQGQLAYCASIEPREMQAIIAAYSQKFGTDVSACIKSVIKGGE